MLIHLASLIDGSALQQGSVYLLSQIRGFPPIIQTVHILGIVTIMGSMVLIDLRLLGLALPSQSIPELTRRLMPWTWVALPFMLGAWRYGSHETRRGAIDWVGALLLGATLSVLTYALVDDPVTPRGVGATAGLLAIATVLGAAFVRYEAYAARTREPLLRLTALASRGVGAANLVQLLVGGGLITALIGVPLFVNLVLAERPLDGGLTLLRLTAAVPVGALLGGWLAHRWSVRGTTTLGMALAAAGFAGLQAWDRDLAEPLRTLPQLVGGLGFGLVIAPLSAAALRGTAERERATLASWLTLSRMVGMLVGTALLTSHGLGRFYARASSIEFGTPEFSALVAEAQVTTFREVFVAAAVVMVIAALLALLLDAGRAGDDDGPWWTPG